MAFWKQDKDTGKWGQWEWRVIKTKENPIKMAYTIHYKNGNLYAEYPNGKLYKIKLVNINH